MGSDQSSPRRIPTTRSTTINSGRHLSPEEVTRLLAEQKKEFERKLREAQATKAAQARSIVTPNVQIAREASERCDENIRGHIQEFIHIAGSSSSTQRGNNSNPVHQVKPNVVRPSDEVQPSSFERERTPYRISFIKENLQNHLYPDLEREKINVNPNIYHPLQPNPGPSRSPAQTNEPCIKSYVFVRSGQPQISPRNSPSAPSSPSEGSPGRKPSISRSNSNKGRNDELNCITCGNKYGLNIYQCSGGHSSCRECKLRNALCGVCKNPISNMRNITLEAVIAERKESCPNEADGCKLFLKLADIETHLKECPYKDFACPLSQIGGHCFWRGKLSQMSAHFDDVHPANRQSQLDTELTLRNIKQNNRNIQLIELGTFNFLVHLKVDENQRQIFLAVQMLGTQISATKWSYEIQVYNKNEPRRKFTYREICNSHAMPVDEIYAQSQCVVIPQDYVERYMNNGYLNYKIYIKKECDFNTPYNNRGRVRGRGGWGRGRGRGRDSGDFRFDNDN